MSSLPVNSVGRLREWVIGRPRDPLNPQTRQHVALIAFFAWIGLGADGLSSACYGPEEAYLALGSHTDFGLYLAAATMITVFVISLAYNQVIELFPNGGGGYKVATQLIGPYAGLVSGSALIVDYVLTIAISVASGADALFSLLPPNMLSWKLPLTVAITAILVLLNLRGMKEAIKVLLPIFLGFVIVHVILIVYGVYAHSEQLSALVSRTVSETHALAAQSGWIFVAGTLIFAYSHGGGTYTGLEAVSNNVNTLAEPRVLTGKWTMGYMAISLAFTAGGILVLYALWNVAQQPGLTLNAVVFDRILRNYELGSDFANHAALLVVLALEAGLLFVAANTGFLGGPAVLANMAADSWVPRQFRQLSSRLVTQNGILLMGGAALAVLLWSHGSVALLVVLYSINVFLTFSIALCGLCIYWWDHRNTARNWKSRFALSVTGFLVCIAILLVLLIGKFFEGGWVTLIITGGVIAICLAIRRHYEETREQLRKVDNMFASRGPLQEVATPPLIKKDEPTAVFFVGKNRGVGMHALLWVQRLFPNHFKNFIFLAAGEVDAQSFGGAGALQTLKYEIENSLHYYVNFCNRHGLAAASECAFGTDAVEELMKLADKVRAEFPNCVFFASRLIFERDNFFTRWLHNQTSLVLQQRLHLLGVQMVILPMKVS